jgi:hypothetical protein
MIAAAFSGSAAPPVTSDPYYEYTTLLLPGNGTNGAQNNTFLDSSTNNFTITRNGNTTQGTFSPFSQTGWGNYFSGSSQYLSVADSTAFTMGTGDFTVEYWVYWNGTSSTFRAYGQVDSGGSSASISIRGGIDASNKVINGAFSGTTDYLCTSTASLVANTWNHIAFVRDGPTLRQYINGGQDGTASISTASVNDSSSQFAIGRAGEFNGNYFGGYISNFRLVKGRCVYPSGTSFTPPTSPLTRTTGGTNPPQGTETSLLTCQSNRFLDSNGPNTPASSPLTITVNGSPSVQAFSPFNPSASWSAATYGGSGYFDGTGDSLSAASNAAFAMGTGDFSIECWIYFLGTARGGGASGEFFGSTTTGSIVLRYLSGTLALSRVGTADDMSASVTLTTGQWYHICATRTGTTGGLYLNGDRVATNSSYTASYAQGEMQCISGTNGYFSSCRLVKGSNPYGTGSTITLPTAPLTAITNTSLLLNYTNAGIYDATSKNDLETVGNAQISTAQSKWGGSSMAFDGTGDYLGLRNSVLFDFGSGDFTVEAWLYIAGNSSLDASNRRYAAIFSVGTTSAYDFIFNLRGNSTTTGTGIEIYSLTNGAIGVNGTITQSVWNHIAVSKSGSSVYFWLNGTQLGTTQTGVTGSWGSSSNNAQVARGAVTGYTYELNGYLQDLRITRGYARYTANFTAPTAAFPTL